MDGDVTVNSESNGDAQHDQTPAEEKISIEISSSNGVDNNGYVTEYTVDTKPNKNGTTFVPQNHNQDISR